MLLQVRAAPRDAAGGEKAREARGHRGRRGAAGAGSVAAGALPANGRALLHRGEPRVAGSAGAAEDDELRGTDGGARGEGPGCARGLGVAGRGGLQRDAVQALGRRRAGH